MLHFTHFVFLFENPKVRLFTFLCLLHTFSRAMFYRSNALAVVQPIMPQTSTEQLSSFASYTLVTQDPSSGIWMERQTLTRSNDLIL